MWCDSYDYCCKLKIPWKCTSSQQTPYSIRFGYWWHHVNLIWRWINFLTLRVSLERVQRSTKTYREIEVKPMSVTDVGDECWRRHLLGDKFGSPETDEKLQWIFYCGDQNWNNFEYWVLSFAFFLFRFFIVLSLIALFAQEPNPDLDPDSDPNVFAAGDLKLNFKGLPFPFLG